MRGRGGGVEKSKAHLELVAILGVLQRLYEGGGGLHGGYGHLRLLAAQAGLQQAVQGAHVLRQGGHDEVGQLRKDVERRLHLLRGFT